MKKKFGKNCKFCIKVKAHVGKYGQCRPHALLQAYHDDPCHNCEFIDDCRTENDEKCRAGFNWSQPNRKFFRIGNFYGNKIEFIRKEWYGYKYIAHNGNSAKIIFGKIFQYKYFGRCRQIDQYGKFDELKITKEGIMIHSDGKILPSWWNSLEHWGKSYNIVDFIEPKKKSDKKREPRGELK